MIWLDKSTANPIIRNRHFGRYWWCGYCWDWTISSTWFDIVFGLNILCIETIGGFGWG